jgi:olfactory receptor
MLVNIQTQSKVISFKSCIIQMHFFLLFIMLDVFLLTVMTYDRFVAICHPLHYTVIMNPRVCVLLVFMSWVGSSLYSVLETLIISQLSFCGHSKIPHFFCEVNQVVQLACSGTFLYNVVTYIGAVLLGACPLACILYSYSKIISSICSISSSQGKCKAFSTCASHSQWCPYFIAQA